MRTIIAGSRFFYDYDTLLKVVDMVGWRPSVVLSGACRGADLLGERWAEENNVPIEKYPADWKTLKNAAGPIRNSEMAEKADALIAFWDGRMGGTADMIKKARKRGLTVVVWDVT